MSSIKTWSCYVLILFVVNIKHMYVGGFQNPVTVDNPFIVVKGSLKKPFIWVFQCLGRAQCVRVCLQQWDVAGMCFYRPRCWGGLAAQGIEGSDRAVKMCCLVAVLLCCRHSWHYMVCVCVMSLHGNQRTSHCFFYIVSFSHILPLHTTWKFMQARCKLCN